MKRTVPKTAIVGESTPDAAKALQPDVIPGGETRVAESDLFWEEMARVGRQEVEVAGQMLRAGSRVILRPRPGGDLLDRALAGRRATVEAVDEDDTGSVHVAVIIEDDPGRDLGGARHPAHRFFFAPGELEPLAEPGPKEPQRRVLVAGIGNVFLGDDGFGVAVAQRLSGRQLPAGIDIVDFGIRGMDLAYALGQPYHAAILVDAVPGAGQSGVLVVMEAELDGENVAALDGHRMDPLSVLRLARGMGPLPEKILIVGCRAEGISAEWSSEITMSLSTPVAAAVEKAAQLVEQLAARIISGSPQEAVNQNTKGASP
jgi:hydrogenase maturation protease